jgi:cytoskeletal protein RodZ
MRVHGHMSGRTHGVPKERKHESLENTMMSRKHGTWRLLLAISALVVMLSGSISGTVWAQEAQPTQDPAQLVDPTLPQDTTPEATEEIALPPVESTPEPTQQPATTTTTTTVSAQRVDPATSPGSPATLAHGLAFYDGDDLVWQAQEMEVPVIAEASGTVSAPSIVVQREGQSIIRNDSTGKRALITPGEAFFITADDSYTIMAEDEGSMVWKFSLVDPDVVAGDAFYESPPLTSLRNGTYDLRLVRYVLNPGDTAELPANSGAGMVMPGAGEVQVDHGGQLSLLGIEGTQGQGQVLRQPTSIANTGGDPTVVFYLYTGESVGDESSAPPQNAGSTTSTTSTSNSSTEATVAPAADDTASDPTAEESSATTSPQEQPADGPYLAQVNIYAESEIYLTVTVDGVVWFDGTLPAGAWTGPMNGSSFEVYTTNGSATLFENACGTQFYMGEEPGEATYVLAADANSCPPSGE